jgi:hypothetical protein
VPSPHRDYRWEPSTNNPVAELEAEIENIRRQRQNFLRECAVLWRWLAEEEATYETNKESYPLEEKIRRRRVLETQGNMHMSTWVLVSQSDWMVADLNKRIEQIRSAKQSEDGKTVTWLPGVSAEASANGLETSRALMKPIAKAIRANEDGLKELKSQTVIAMGDPDALNDAPDRSAMTGKVVDKKQAWRDILERLRLALIDARDDSEVVDRILKEAERRDRG